MDMNKIGKFESLKIINEVDKALIELFGINITDAHITRYEVLSAYEKTGCPRKTAEMFGRARGMKPLVETT